MVRDASALSAGMHYLRNRKALPTGKQRLWGAGFDFTDIPHFDGSQRQNYHSSEGTNSELVLSVSLDPRIKMTTNK